MNSLSRIDKLFADRDRTDPATSRTRREEFTVAIHCGADVAGSYTLQIAALTAASIANRCFPGAVRIVLDENLRDTPLLVWPSLRLTIGQAFREIAGDDAFAAETDTFARTIMFGNARIVSGALRVTFDGWIASVGPVTAIERLQERQYCPLAGILAASIGISETFLSFADISLQAGRRVVTVSLWRPDSPHNPSALGVPIEVLPAAAWLLGLGHLGNAYIWTLASLPYATPIETRFFLNDFDGVEKENLETGVLFRPTDIDRLKTRICSAWLESRGFQTRLIERHFDSNFRRRDDEPGLAFSGFDSNPVRRCLESANLLSVVDSGLGGTATNFDTISLHTFPNPREASELWPDLPAEELEKRRKEQERIAQENPAYLATGQDECGRYALAGKSVSVPFVGITASAFVMAEALRRLHDGPAFTDLKFRLSVPNECSGTARTSPYRVSDTSGLTYTEVDPNFDLSC